ncbi:uncharacterized protein PgNI_07124 [Pyricularia grisea]|uniref:Uncharacterized protein n=1 Tax=Pyricularia grisea TaxID=148305 RepID=A0A6P8B2M6_PYRGI|nr:uncharacterized protein PgNI_07124 [Pyricularia grisea]TLD09111.1 hypothetical protein PgNI_07124 [Pyricularia grisea]
MSAEQEGNTGRAGYQPSRRLAHVSEGDVTNKEGYFQRDLLGFVPGVPQQLIYRDALGRNRLVSIQEAVKSARDENNLTEALYLSRFLSPSALVAEEVLRRRRDRAIEEALNAEPRRDARRREAEWGFALDPGKHGIGDVDATKVQSPTSRNAGVPAWWRTVHAASLGETARPERVAGIWPSWPKNSPADSVGDQSHGTKNIWNDTILHQGRESQKTSTAQPEMAARDGPSTNAINSALGHHETIPVLPSEPSSAVQPQLHGRPSQASLRTRGSFSSYASTISLTHVDAHSNMLDCDAMGGFFVIQQQFREQQQQQPQDYNGDESDDDQEPFGTRAGIFRPLGRDHHPNMTRRHSRECKEKCRNNMVEKAAAVLDDEQDDYVIVEKPREPLEGA